jgi:general secretion pathway protein G
MVVIAILGLLMSVITFKVVESMDEADVKLCKVEMETIAGQLKKYYTEHREFPDSGTGLSAIEKHLEDTTDPWGNEYQYVKEGDSFNLISLGKDGEQGGEDAGADISYNDIEESD